MIFEKEMNLPPPKHPQSGGSGCSPQCLTQIDFGTLMLHTQRIFPNTLFYCGHIYVWRAGLVKSGIIFGKEMNLPPLKHPQSGGSGCSPLCLTQIDFGTLMLHTQKFFSPHSLVQWSYICIESWPCKNWHDLWKRNESTTP